MNDNYFEDLEMSVKDFKKEYKITDSVPDTTNFLESILKNKYGIGVDRKLLAQNKELKQMRSFFSKKQNIFFLNENLKSSQENFLLARELAFQYLNLEERPYSTRILEVDSFEKLLNNFKASYFSAALLMDEEELAKDFQKVSANKKWSEKPLLNLLDKYDVTPEMLFQRLTNILPRHFGIKDLFFLRISGDRDLKKFHMTKEIHLSQLHNPYGNVRDEHYCRRWISINILKRIRASRTGEPIADAQISKYWGTPNEYLCLSIAKPDEQSFKATVSVTIGILMDPSLRRIFGYLDDPDLKIKDVDTTCERCSIPHCGARAAPPVIIEKQEEIERIKEAFQTLEYS